MKLVNAGGGLFEIEPWLVKAERARLRRLGLARSWVRYALVLAGPRGEHHNPPPALRPIDLRPIDFVALKSMIAPLADLLGLPLPGALRRMSETASSVMMGRIAREAFNKKDKPK